MRLQKQTRETHIFVTHEPIPRNNQNSYMRDYMVVSRRQIEFGIYVRNHRRMNNLSQAQFAELCTILGKKKITQKTVSNWENFESVPSESNMNTALEVMHITKEYLN